LINGTRCVFIAIVKSLAGSPGRVTDPVDINPIPILYKKMVASLRDYDFVSFNLIGEVRIVYI